MSSENSSVVVEGLTSVAKTNEVANIMAALNQPKQRKPRVSIADDDFIVAWEGAENVRGVVLALVPKYGTGVTEQVVSAKANMLKTKFLKKTGKVLPLREFQRGRQSSDSMIALQTLAKIRGCTVEQLIAESAPRT